MFRYGGALSFHGRRRTRRRFTALRERNDGFPSVPPEKGVSSRAADLLSQCRFGGVMTRMLACLWAVSLTFVLGAASALLASYLKLRNVQNAPVAVTQVDVPEEAPVAVNENPPAETPLADVEETSDEVNTEESIPEESAPKKAPVKRRSVVVAAAKPDDYISDPSDTRRMNEEDSLHQIRENVLYDEWQERRARRVWRRERRRAERYNHRDLSNLDEIFEGRRRPNP